MMLVEELPHSGSNGDRWLPIRDIASDQAVVCHEADRSTPLLEE